MESANWPLCRRLTPHVAALLDTGAAPATAAMDMLLNQAAIYLDQMAEPAQSLRFAREALRLTEARLPEADRAVALGHANLGEALRQSGDLVQAELHTARAVTLNEAHRPGSADLADSFGLHGQVLAEIAGREAEALRRLQQALALRRQLFGRWHDAVALSLNQLAWLRRRRGQAAAALRLYSASLTIRRRVLPPGDARLGFALMNTGAALLEAGQAAEAEPLLEQALALREAVHHRADHPDRRVAAGWLISCLLVRAAAGEDVGRCETQAKALCAAYGFEFEERKAQAGQYAYRPGGGERVV